MYVYVKDTLMMFLKRKWDDLRHGKLSSDPFFWVTLTFCVVSIILLLIMVSLCIARICELSVARQTRYATITKSTSLHVCIDVIFFKTSTQLHMQQRFIGYSSIHPLFKVIHKLNAHRSNIHKIVD